MGKISQSATIKGKEVKIGGIDLVIKPLQIDAIEYLMDLGEGDKMPCPHCQKEIVIPSKDMTLEEKSEYMRKRGIAIKKLAFETIKQADPDSSDEEIKMFCMRNLKEIMEVVVEVNELKNAAV